MPTLSLNMIVKNEERHLARCLSSVKDVVDEIIIVDTGSTDKTIEIAEAFGAKVFHFIWVDDFSAARNFALSKCTCDWVLYLDADEELNKNSIDVLLNKINGELAGISCIVRSLESDRLQGSIMKYPRLFPNAPGINFVGKVHEQISDSLKESKYQIVHSDIEIIHHGYVLDDEGLKQKKERNLALLLSSENNKNNIYDKHKLIHTLISLGKYEDAEPRLKKLIKEKSLTDEKRSLTYFYLASVKYEKNDLNSALSYGLKASRVLKDKPELNYLIYLVYFRLNKIEEAKDYLLISIKTNKSIVDKNSLFNSENILDQVDLYIRAINLYINLDNVSEAYKMIEELSEFLSNKMDKKIIFSIFENLLIKYSFSNSNIELLSKLIDKSHLSIIMEIINNCNNKEVVKEIVSVMLQFYPNSALLYRNLALLLVNFDSDKAIEIFNKSLEIESDPTAYIYLISIYVSKNDYKNVIESFNSLQNKFSKNIQIKQKIDILGEKLNPILTASAS